MEQQLNLNPIQEALGNAKSILILFPANPSLDKVAASLALYLSFKKQGKQVLVACPSAMTVAFNHLVAVDKVVNRLGNRNLIISFHYLKDSIEKVSYNIEDNKFNLVVEPKSDCPSLESDKVSYSYSGVDADLIFILGASKLEDLDKLYFNEKKAFENALTVNINNKSNGVKFGKVNLINSKFASCSEIAALIIRKLNLAVDQDISANILAGIKANTSNFQGLNTSASTFETASWCLKNGARKELIQPKPVQPVQPVQQGQPIQQGQLSQQNIKQPPPDWFKPKIYKGSTNI